MLKPDLSTASLHVLETYYNHDFDFVNSADYRICEDTLVTWRTYNDYHRNQYRCNIYMGSTSACFANVTSNGTAAAQMLLPDEFNVLRPIYFQVCPASGRFVLVEDRNVAVLDVF
jgi:hypothetical protein